MIYSLYSPAGSITADEIISRLDAAVPLQAAHIASVRKLCAEGCRYSYQDTDVLAAALAAVGKSEIEPWAEKWVAAMTLAA